MFAREPWLQSAVPVSDDPKLVAKILEILGLYLDPPRDAVVISVDEKTQIPAGPRQQDSSRLTQTDSEFGRPTTTLMAALDVHSGKVVGRCMQRQRHTDLLRFLHGR